MLCLYSGIKLDFSTGFTSISFTITGAPTVLWDLIWHLHLAKEQKHFVRLKCNDSGFAQCIFYAVSMKGLCGVAQEPGI